MARQLRLGGEEYYPAECVSELNLDTTAVSQTGTGGTDRVQGTAVDPLSGNVWFAGFQSHTVWVGNFGSMIPGRHRITRCARSGSKSENARTSPT